MNHSFVSAVILASGSGNRFGGDKLFCSLLGKTVLERTISVFEECEIYSEIIIVTREDLLKTVKKISENFSKVKAVVIGGNTRMESSLKGVLAASEESEFVAIHDGARPLLTSEKAKEVVENAIKYGASILASPSSDTVKIAGDGFINETPDRKTVFSAQTPQVFRKEEYLVLLKEAVKSNGEWTDDSSIYEMSGKKVYITLSDSKNIKITYPEDLEIARALLRKEKPSMKIGYGYDVHKFAESRKLILGGVEIPFEMGLLGHSDADVLTHAIMDSLLGAISRGDIGKLFPDTDMAFKDADSLLLLKKVGEIVSLEGYKIGNIDSVVCLEKPKLRPFIDEMRRKIADALNTDIDRVSVKATTEEGLGFTGAMMGISATAVCILENN